jgi:exopolyphosphatase/guanosine-5'-triphosphate,3'-diphosphate pyrophosphatase
LTTTAVIDVGSNTIHLSLYEHGERVARERGEGAREQDKRRFNDKDSEAVCRLTRQGFRLLASHKTVAGLARFMNGGELSTQGINELLDTLKRFEGVLDSWGNVRTHAFATASLRYADNAARVVERVRAVTGLGLELLSGEDEAWLGFLGARSDTRIGDGVVVDIGGASCEFTTVLKDAPVELQSVHMGCLSLATRVAKGDGIGENEAEEGAGEARRMRDVIREQLEGVDQQLKRRAELLCFVGGTARNTRKIVRELRADKSYEMAKEDVTMVARGLEERDPEVCAALRRVAPERHRTLLPGALIMEEILERAQSRALAVSERGVREGYLLDRIIGDGGD